MPEDPLGNETLHLKEFRPLVQLGNTYNTRHKRATAAVPGDLVDQTALQKQVSVGEQAVTDEVLVGAHGHAVTQRQGRQHLQHLGGFPSRSRCPNKRHVGWQCYGTMVESSRSKGYNWGHGTV